MPAQHPPAPGWALNEYQDEAELLLQDYKHGNISFATLLDRHQGATARLSGKLTDRFLVRAHAWRNRATVRGQHADGRAVVDQ